MSIHYLSSGVIDTTARRNVLLRLKAEAVCPRRVQRCKKAR